MRRNKLTYPQMNQIGGVECLVQKYPWKSTIIR
jgi:hypothetical protein